MPLEIAHYVCSRQLQPICLCSFLSAFQEKGLTTLYCRSMASLGSSFIFGLFLMFFARLAYLMYACITGRNERGEGENSGWQRD